MHSAELAARMLLMGRFDARQLRRDYASLWRARSIGCRTAAMIVSTRSISNWIAPALRRTSIISRAMMMLIGK
jgi:hypothetical protein